MTSQVAVTHGQNSLTTAVTQSQRFAKKQPPWPAQPGGQPVGLASLKQISSRGIQSSCDIILSLHMHIQHAHTSLPCSLVRIAQQLRGDA